METQVKRLFVGGLPSSATDSEIKTRFGRFGDISGVKLSKKDSVNGKLEHCFAHFNFHGDEQQLKKLIGTFNSTRWKGKTLKIEPAKEDFLDKLAKEKSELPQDAPTVVCQTRADQLLENLKKAGADNFVLKKAVPGTGITGEKNWVVSKYGRVLPVLYLRTRDKRKVVKFDPSKYIHHLKQIKDIRDSQVNQSWKGEAITPTSVREKWLPREQESDGVEYCGQRTGSEGYEDRQRGKGMGDVGTTYDAAKLEKDANESSACHAPNSAKPANAKKLYFNDGSSDEDSGTFDGSLKRKPGYDGNLSDENKGSKLKKMKKLEMTSANIDISCGTIPAEVRVHKAKAIAGNKISVTGRGLVSFGKANTDSYLFKFFDESDSSPSEVEHMDGSAEQNIESIVDEDSVKSPSKKMMEMCSDLEMKNKKEQNTADAKNVEVEVNKNMSKSESNHKVNERKPRRDPNITGNRAGAKTELSEESDCSSSSSEETGDRSETISALTEAAVVPDCNQSRGGNENEPSSVRPHEVGEDDLIASIIAEMKHKETTEKRVTDLGTAGRGIDGTGITNLGDVDNQSLQRSVNEADSRKASQNIYQERFNSNDHHHHFQAEVKKDKITETERASGFDSKKLDVLSKSEGKNEANSTVAETKRFNSSKEKLTKRRWEKNGALSNDNSSIVGEGGSGLFKSTLLSLSKQRQGEKSHTESDCSSSDEDKEEDNEMEEKAITETAHASELVSKKSSEEKVVKNPSRTKNSSNCRQTSPSDIKMCEVELRTDEQIDEKKDIDIESAEEYLNLQGEDLKEMHFKPLILDRVILKMQGFIPEEEPCPGDTIIDERDTSSADDSESESSQSSSDGKASKKRKKKKRIKFLFHEFKGMNHFRKEFADEKSSDVDEGEKLDSVHGEVYGMDLANCREVRTSDDQPTDGKDFSNLRGGGGMEDLEEDDERTFGEDRSRVNEIPQTSEKMVFAVDAAPRRKKTFQMIKNYKESDSVEVREESDHKEMDADDESSSSESMSSDSMRKKRSCKNIRNVTAKSSVSHDGKEVEVLEGASLLSCLKTKKEAKGRTKTSERNIQTKDDSDKKMEWGDYVEETEDEGKALSISKGEKMTFRRRAKTSPLVEECKTDHPSGDEKGSSEHVPSEDFAMGHSRAGLKAKGRAGKTVSDSVAKISNQKRLKALKERRDELKQKQKAIQVALSSVDSREKLADKNHMRFESSSEDDSDTGEGGEDDVEKMEPKGGHMTLFGDSDEEEDDLTHDLERFQLKPQFEGEKGAKLLKLQDKFGDDERFRLDERFAEDDEDEDGSAVTRETEERDKADPVEEEGEDLEAEKDRYLAVLENVLGKQLPRKKVVEDKKSKFKDVNYLHFDPTREDHAKFELPRVKDEEDSQIAASKKKRKKKKKVAEDEANDPLPEVSKELFSEVTADLVSAFSQDGNVASFSFFDDEDEVIKEEKDDDQNKKDEGEMVPFADNFLVKRKLPWDSSDSEQEAEHDEDGEKEVAAEEAEVTEAESTKEHREVEEPLLKLRAPESFFFAKNDNRLQGVANQFCRGKNEDVTSDWKDARTQILKAGSKRHQKALRDNQKNRRRGRPATLRSKSSVGKS